MQAFNPRSDQVWSRPDWHANPFSISQPIQFFHLMAFYALATAAIMLPISILMGRTAMQATLFGGLGAGSFVGVRFSVLVYARKFA
jgi:hypothetical protein